MSSLIYFDYASSTCCDPEVVRNILPFFSLNFSNPSNTTNSLGKDANYAVEVARNKVAKFLNCLPQNIIWTSGATESNNIAIQGTVKRFLAKNQASTAHIISSSIEHKSVLEPLKALKGVEVSYVKPTRNGSLLIEDIENSIRENTFLVSIMIANNELGVINDIEAISKICKSKGILLHTDATQAIGKISLDLSELQVDFLSFSGHKIHAPKGIGALFIRDLSVLRPLYYGGGHERGYRPGTLNVPGIVGLGVACEICQQRHDEENNRIGLLRNLFESQITSLNSDIIVNSKEAMRLPNISSITFPVKKGYNILDEITLIACSSGSACDSQDNLPSHVLMEIGKTLHESKNTIRFSFGRFTTEDEIYRAIDHLHAILKKVYVI
jgi:cysteine desulfurase